VEQAAGRRHRRSESRRAWLAVALIALSCGQAGYVQAASPTPSDGPTSPPPVLPSHVDSPRPARPENLGIPSDAASGGSNLDPSIQARPKSAAREAPSARTEIEDARTERSRLIANTDGSFTLEQSTGRLHFRTAQAEWAPIDLSLLPSDIEGFDLEVAANDRQLRFATNAGDGPIAQLAADGRALGLKLVTPGTAERVPDARHGVDRLTYAIGDLRPDFYIQPTTDGLTFGATWADSLADPSLELVLDLQGYQARVAPDGATIELFARIPGEPALSPMPSGVPAPSPTPIPEPTPSPTATPTPESSASSEPVPPSPTPAASESPIATPSPTLEPAVTPGSSLAALNTPSEPDQASFEASASAATMASPEVPEASEAATASPSPTETPPPSPQATPIASPSLSPTPSPTRSPAPSPIPVPSDVPIGVIGAPVILEGQDRALTSAPISVAIMPGPSADEVVLRYSLDPAWLSDEDREFPIELDPSICIQAGGSGCITGSGKVMNTYIGSGQPDTYPNPPSILRVGYDVLPDVAWNTMRSLIWFESQTLLDGAVVTAATLRLREDINRDASLTPDIIARPISKTWGNTATWSQMGNAVRSGMDSPAVNPCSSGSTDCDVNIDVEEAVRSWYTRRAKDWKSNYGFQVRLATESSSLSEIDFYISSGCTNATCPKLTITYEVPEVGIDFDPLLGRLYAPSTMIAGRTTRLPIVVTNNGTAQNFTSAYKVGYRWFDAKGNRGSLPSGVTSLPGCIGVGTGCELSRGPFALSVAAPAAAGMYTLRLDLVRTDGSVNLWASDWATPSKYYSRNKKFLTVDDTRWVGSSVVERDEFPITVLTGGGTNAGERRTVTTGAGDELGIGLASRDLTFRGDTGLGFADRIGLQLQYGYSQIHASGCSGYQGILGACGWWTTFDERVSGGPNDTGFDYIYQDPQGDRYLLDTDTEGQIAAGAPVLLNRPRHTLIDDNEPPGAAQAVGVATTGWPVFSGAYASRGASDTNTGTSLPDKVNLNTHKYLRFALRTTAAAQAGLCLKVRNLTDGTTYPDRWFCYTLGATNWTSGFDQAFLNTEIGSLTGGWNDYTRDMWNDIRLDGDFGEIDHEYQVVSVQIQSAGNLNGWTYLDALRFESRESPIIPDEANPSWTSGGTLASSITPSTDDGPAPSGTKVLKVLPANPPTTTSPLCRTTNGCWSSATGGLDSFAFTDWYWKKVGGGTAALVIYVKDLRSGAPCSTTDCSVTYYAGPAQPPFNSSVAIQVSPDIPEQWTLVRRNLLADARMALGLFDDAGSGGPDRVQITGYSPHAVDGSYLLFDRTMYGSLADTGAVDPTGEASPLDRPTTVGDPTRVWDFTADYPDGSRHYFNRDGLLTAIRDLDGFMVSMDWTVTAPTSGPASYRLDKVRAPNDGGTAGGVTFEREFELSRGTDGSLATLRIDEDLGSTTDDRSARAAIFEMSSGLMPDVMKVSPARHAVGPGATGTFCGAPPSGCVEFSYTDATSHRLAFVGDPRWNADTSGSLDYRFEVTRSGADPMSIADRSHGTGGTPLLNILTYNDTRDSGLAYDRVQYQDSSAGAANAAIAVDLAPGGLLFTGYAPRVCTGTCSTAGGTWPAHGTQADFKTVRHEFDGVSKVNTARTYRCPAANDAVSGCKGTVEQVSLSRQARQSGARVDNYADPLAAEEIAWRQSPEQWFASVRDSGGGNPDIYRTEFRYDGRHRVVSTREPVQLAASTYADGVSDTLGVTNWWRLDESSGTDVLDSFGTGVGTRSGALPDQAGVLVRANPNKAYAFDGVNDRVTAPVSISQTGYSVEAWVRPGTNVSGRALAGRWTSAGGVMLWTDALGRYVLVHTATGSNYLTSQVKASPDRTDHVVGTWSGQELRLYVNGQPAGSRAMAVAPGSGATSFEIGSANNGASYPYHGRIDEVALYDRALTPVEVNRHYRAGIASAVRDTRIDRDRSGRPTVTEDQFLANGSFEAGLANWASAGSVTASSAAQHTGTPGGLGASLAPGALTRQIVDVVPGQTVRFQYYQSGTGAALTATVRSWTVGGSGFDETLLTHASTATGWTGHAWDLAVPTDSDGRLAIIFSASGGGTAYLDDTVVLTRWTSTTYGTVVGPTLGLPTAIDTLLPGCTSCTQGTVRATLAYAAGTTSPSLHPAMFPTTTIANDVASVSDPSTQDVTSTTAYDAWGRVAATTDPDGVSATTTYAANGTDVGSTADDPDNGAATTNFGYDAVGNRTVVISPLGRTTTTTYDGLNHPLTVTAPDGTVTRHDYNDLGQQVRTWSNYQNGTTTDGDASDDLLVIRTYDAYGRVSQTDADCAATGGVPNCNGGLDAQTRAAYDLPGTTVVSTVFSASGGDQTSARSTTSRFETYDPNVGPYAGLRLTRLTPTATLLPIAPGASAPTCPDGSGDCNAVLTLDLAGRTVSTTDAYGVVTRLDLDLEGRPVRVIRNVSTDPNHGGDNDENLETLTRYDLLGRAERTTMVMDVAANDRWTRQLYDPLGRVTETITGSGSVTLVDRTSSRTRYTAAGRVTRASSTEIVTADDTGRAWTRTEYDADGRAVRTLENAEIATPNTPARRYVDHFEDETSAGWSASASGYFTTSAAAAGPAFDAQASTIPAATGRHRLRVTTSATGTNSGLWRDYSGRTFKGTGSVYRLRASLWAPASQAINVYLGIDASGQSQATTTVTGTGAWQTVSLDWDPSADVSANVHAAFRKDAAGGVDFGLDDVMLYETGSANGFDIATDTAYDSDGRVIASVSPPGDADGDRPLVTRTAYDALDRVVAIATNAVEPYAAAVRGTTGLAGYWPLDEVAGSTIDDRQTATDLTAAGARVLGVAGGLDEARSAVRVDGATGYASRPSTPVSATDDFALEAWFRYDTIPPSSQVIAYAGTSTTGWGIGFNAGKLAGVYGSTWLDSGQAPAAGLWHHVVLSRASGTATIYLDGTAYAPTNSSASPSAPGANFAIGRQDVTTGRYFAGDIDEVAIYGAPMSASTVGAHWAAGRPTSVVDGLTTKNVYDALGRPIDAIDQAGIRTRSGYDRLGSLTSVIRNHQDGTPTGELGTDDVKTTYGRNVVGELVGYCSGKNLWDASQVGGPIVCDPVTTSNGYAWHYAYDALGRMIRQTPPDNQTVADLAALEWDYEASGRLEQVCEDIADGLCDGSNPKRTEYDQDGLGRVLVERAIKGASTITTTTAYGLDGQPTSVTDGTTTVGLSYIGTSGLPDTVSVGGSTVTDYAWGPDDTLAGRNDGGAGSPTVSFGYDWAKRLTSIDPPDADYGTGNVSRSYRLDGLLKSQIWPNGETATLVYDTARRPTAVNLTAGRSLTRSYDRTGRVTSDDRYLGAGIAAPAGDGTLSYQYDPLGRITETKLDGLTSATYTYDRGSNRRTKTEGGQTFTYAHDRTDAIASQKIGADSALAFVYDSAGNVVTERTKGGVARTYVWDAADRLTKIDDPTGNDADLVYDPLDRVKTRTVGSDIQTFSYVGVTDDLWRQAGTSTSSGLLDADGARVGTKTGSTGSWLLFDLLGSVAAAEATSGTTITDALRYDAWGQTLGVYPATGSSQPTRFRGLVDLAPTADPDVAGPGSDPLYLMGARTYSPHTGAFTSLDSYAGSAIDPASLHRYLYAHANPTTLIDPDGHRACEFDPCEDTPAKEWVDRENAPPPAPSPNQSGSPDDRNSGTTTSTGTQTTSGGTPPDSRVGDSHFAATWSPFLDEFGVCDELQIRNSGCDPMELDELVAALKAKEERDGLRLQWTLVGVAGGIVTVAACGMTGFAGCVLVSLAVGLATEVPAEFAGDYALGSVFGGLSSVAAKSAASVFGTGMSRLDEASLLVDKDALVHLPQDIAVAGREAPAYLITARSIGGSATQNRDLQQRIADLITQGAKDIRVNQTQVNAQGKRVGTNRPDLQYTLGERRYYEEFDVPSSQRGLEHQARIFANDPEGTVYLWISP
jgi:RHS repeat-associated protein